MVLYSVWPGLKGGMFLYICMVLYSVWSGLKGGMFLYMYGAVQCMVWPEGGMFLYVYGAVQCMVWPERRYVSVYVCMVLYSVWSGLDDLTMLLDYYYHLLVQPSSVNLNSCINKDNCDDLEIRYAFSIHVHSGFCH